MGKNNQISLYTPPPSPPPEAIICDYIKLSRVWNANKQKQKEETAGSSGDSLNQKRQSSLLRLFLLDALVLNLGYQCKP